MGVLNSQITRRDFMGASAAVAAGAAVCAGANVAFADDDAMFVAAASNDPASPDYTTESLKGYQPKASDPIPPVAAPEAWDREADVVVVGGGIAGLTAALYCADHGKSVILLEKTSVTGGDSAVTNVVAVLGCKAQTEAGIVLPEGIIDGATQSKWSSCAYTFDLPMVTKLTYRNIDAVNYLIDSGADLVPCPRGEGGVNWRGAMDDGCAAYANKILTTFVTNKAVELGAEIMYNAPAAALVESDGAIVGVKTEDGLYIKGGATVVATGSFASNREMLKKYCPTGYRLCSQTGCGPQNVGDGQRMLWGAGAGIGGWNSFFALDGGIDSPELSWSGYFYTGYTQLVRQPWLRVDKNCKRVKYDSTVYGSGVDAAIGYQGCIDDANIDHRSYVFFDSNYEKYAPTYGEEICRWLFTSDMPSMQDTERMGLLCNDWREGTREGIEAGIIVSADTIAELAEKLGLDPAAMEACVASWNEKCANGVDDELGYNELWLNPIDTPPYYAAKTSADIISTLTGARVNDAAQVLDAAGDVIPGLYAAGCCAGISGINGMLSSNVLGGMGAGIATAFVAAEDICK